MTVLNKSNWTPDRVKRLRSASGMSQTNFAKLVGVSRAATVSGWERGVSTPSVLAEKMLEGIEKEVESNGNES